MKIYIVKTFDPCECDSPCYCQGYTIDSVYTDKKKAEARAKAIWKGYVDDYEVTE